MPKEKNTEKYNSKFCTTAMFVIEDYSFWDIALYSLIQVD
jgi:hypothetical protein